MTLLEAIQRRVHDHEAAPSAAIETALEICAQWTLEPCVANDEVFVGAVRIQQCGHPDYIPLARPVPCRHCMATFLLEEIGQAIGVYP